MSNLKLLLNDFQVSDSIFQTEKKRLEETLIGFSIRIEHIGSTAIPKTIGKGIIDMLLICQNENDLVNIKDVFVSNGYIQGELNKKPDGRLFFTNSVHQTQAGDTHLHVVVKDSNNLVSLQFCDYLLLHPDEVERYNHEKQRLSFVSNNSKQAYATQKEAFILEVMKGIKV